jgi:hypothetical protein
VSDTSLTADWSAPAPPSLHLDGRPFTWASLFGRVSIPWASALGQLSEDDCVVIGRLLLAHGCYSAADDFLSSLPHSSSFSSIAYVELRNILTLLIKAPGWVYPGFLDVPTSDTSAFMEVLSETFMETVSPLDALSTGRVVAAC